MPATQANGRGGIALWCVSVVSLWFLVVSCALLWSARGGACRTEGVLGAFSGQKAKTKSKRSASAICNLLLQPVGPRVRPVRRPGNEVRQGKCKCNAKAAEKQGRVGRWRIGGEWQSGKTTRAGLCRKTPEARDKQRQTGSVLSGVITKDDKTNECQQSDETKRLCPTAVSTSVSW